MLKHALAGLIAVSILAAPAAAAAQGETKTGTEASTPKKKVRGSQSATRARQKQCGAEWREAKAAGKIAEGMTWPKYWSECNKRLKAKSG
jgi:uncharacterized low-complexity protein